MEMKYDVLVQKEENRYIVKCKENNIVSQGITLEEALDNLKEDLELYAQRA